MKKFLVLLCGMALLASTVGCANGPIRQWFRGAPCNTCHPQIQRPLNVAPNCNSQCAENAVGTGILGRLFRGNNQQVANCPTGTCNATVPPNSVPASSFANQTLANPGETLPLVVDGVPTAAPPSAEMYGNTNTVGRLELPPISYNNN